jgi:molybdopterin synthase catalytic subunit
VKTRHSAEGFELCRWYLREIKTSVPIWKKPVWVVAEGKKDKDNAKP